MMDKILFAILFNVLLLLTPTLISGNEKNGEYTVGDSYKKSSYATKAYEVYRLPYGVEFAGMTYNPQQPGQFLFALDHTICPDGQSCGGREELFVSIDPSTLTIESIVGFSNSTLGTLSQRPTPFQLSKSGAAVVLMDYYLLYVNVSTGEILDYIAVDYGFTVVNMDLMNEDTLYVYDYRANMLSIFDVSNNYLNLNNSISFASYNIFMEPINSTYAVECAAFHYDFRSKLLYLGGNQNQLQPIVIVFDTVKQEVQNVIQVMQSSIPNGNAIVGGIFSGQQSLYVVIENQSSATSDGPFAGVLVRYEGSSMEYIDIPDFRAYVGNFRDQSDNLYVYTDGGQIFRVSNANNNMTLDGCMTIVTQRVEHSQINNYVSGVMPYLGPHIFAPHDFNTVFLTAQWWGMIIKVDISNFCLDTENCEVPDIFPKWAIAVIVVCFVLIFVGIITTIVCIRRRRHHKHSYGTIQSHHHHHHDHHHHHGHGHDHVSRDDSGTMYGTL